MMNAKTNISLYAMTIIMLGCVSQTPLKAKNVVKPPAPFLPVPTVAQLKWHKAEYKMFIHFGMKTFYPSSNHMGHGKENPKKFNPKLFDANQWVAAAKAGGFEGIVLTTKHHDGFCNWPTDTTDHSVRSSPWKEGKGDIVKELTEACKAGNISFGFYVSIIDEHYKHAGSSKHKNYGEYYYDQIKELSTRYGSIGEYWFDGFKADQLKMDYKKIANLIRTTQPNAVVYDSGTFVKYLPNRCLQWPGRHGGVGADQDYRHKIEDEQRWYPNEPSIILQGNWFHQGKPMIALDHIKDYYLKSVGHGVTPLMNVSPNQNGLIDAASIKRLKEFKAWVDRLHANDLTRRNGVRVSATNVRGNAPLYAAERILDGNNETYHATDNQVKDVTIEIDLGGVQEIDGFILQEHIALGQRVNGYSVECHVDGQWVEVFHGKKIGYKRIILEGCVTAKGKAFPAADRVRLKIQNAQACPMISTFQVIGKMD